MGAGRGCAGVDKNWYVDRKSYSNVESLVASTSLSDKPTDEEDRKIFLRWLSGESQVSISRDYPMHKRTIGKVIVRTGKRLERYVRGCIEVFV